MLAHVRWFSPGTLASSTTKTGRHDIAEILLKVALNTKNQSIIKSATFVEKNICTWYFLIWENFMGKISRTLAFNIVISKYYLQSYIGKIVNSTWKVFYWYIWNKNSTDKHYLKDTNILLWKIYQVFLQHEKFSILLCIFTLKLRNAISNFFYYMSYIQPIAVFILNFYAYLNTYPL